MADEQKATAAASRQEVIYQEIVRIDGRTYVLTSCDYTESINEQIRDNIIEDENQGILDSITDDIVNH